MEKIKLLCLFGGKSDEYEVSLVSASAILQNLDRDRYEITTVGITKAGDWYYYEGNIENIRNGNWYRSPEKLERAALSPSMSDHKLLVFSSDGKSFRSLDVDVVFPIMHGDFSEDGTLQGLLEMTGIPFVGCSCITSAICMDKGYTKLVLANYQIPQAKSYVFDKDYYEEKPANVIADCEAVSSYPLFVKPANAGSSVGASKASGRDELLASIENALAVDDRVVVEEYINGKEVEVAVMGRGTVRASVPGQIVPGSEFYDYETKYSSSSPATYRIPAEIKPETAEAIRRTAVKISGILGVCGLSRVDFFVTEKDGKESFLFNEINTLPGFTEISMYPKLFLYEGMTYSEILDSLIALALNK